MFGVFHFLLLLQLLQLLLLALADLLSFVVVGWKAGGIECRILVRLAREHLRWV